MSLRRSLRSLKARPERYPRPADEERRRFYLRLALFVTVLCLPCVCIGMGLIAAWMRAGSN